LVQQGVDDDPEEERHDHGDQEDGFKRVPWTLGVRLTASDSAVPPDFAAAVLAGHRITATGMRRRWHRRRDVAARRGYLHLAHLCDFTGTMPMHFRCLRQLKS